MVYGCDKAWWEARRGLKEFKGLKICWEGNGLTHWPAPEIERIKILKEGPDVYSYNMVFSPYGTIGGGGNSGFQSVNLAVQWGAKRIILVGFDFHEQGGKHWYGRNIWPGSNNPNEQAFGLWNKAFKKCSPTLKQKGIEVINTSQYSTIKEFSFQHLKDIFPDKAEGPLNIEKVA